MQKTVQTMRGPPLTTRELLGSLLLLGILLVASIVWQPWPEALDLHDSPVHAAIEMLGAVSALLLSLLLLSQCSQDIRASHLYPVSLGFLAMGILDGFHAVANDTLPSFVWLRSLAAFFGGALPALIWFEMGQRLQQIALHRAVAVAASVLGVFFLLHPDALPALAATGRFSNSLDYINVAGGLLSFASAAYFVIRHNRKANREDAIFATLYLVLGCSAVIFPFCRIWEAWWWWWHILRLIAYGLAMRYMFTNHAELLRDMQAEIFERKKVETALRESEEQFRVMVEHAPEAIVVFNVGLNRLVDTNANAERLFGCDREELLKHSPVDFYPLGQPDAMLPKDSVHARSEEALAGLPMVFERVVRNAKGEDILCEVRLVKLPAVDRMLIRGSYIDITERKQSEEAVRNSEARFRYMLETSPIAVRIAASSGHRVSFANQRYAELINSAREQVVGTDPKQFYANPQDYEDISQQLDKGLPVTDKLVELKIPGARTTWALASYFRLEYENEQAVLGWFYDVTDLKDAEYKIQQMAFYDALTQLPNRRLLMDRLNQALSASTRSGQYGAVLFIDLDHFKTLNDTKGHGIGDLLLIEVAKRLKSCVRESDTVSRLGGDEFLVVLETLSTDADEAATQAEMVAEKIRATLSESYTLKERLCYTTSSIGIVLYRGRQESSDDLLRYADTAMYQAKTDGRDAICFYDSAMQLAIDARAELDDELRLALKKQQFCLHYQIQVDNLRHSIGAEVLLRWEHPEHGLVSPAQFIPLAEETGLIIPIGLWVLQTACVQLAAWQYDALTRNLTLAVNVSAKQFHEVDFVAQVQRVLQESGAKPSHLKLELTESTMLKNVEDTIIKMREIEMLGVSFSMDDFGTGYSSLQYLKRLPLSQIKIDQSFVRDIVSDPNDASIVQTIIAMTESLGLNVIAEGVENEEQCQFLELRGCKAFQGYLFSKPVPLDEFMVFLKNRG